LPVRVALLAQAAGALPAGSLVLVMTHDHQQDFDTVVEALQCRDLLAVGLIGSDTKRARFLGRLARQRIATDKLICPIGLPGIEGKEPAVVAVSVAAQILQLQPQPLQRSAAPMPIGERSCGDCVCPPAVATEARR
jgi:xanthine dehydrogenase accessory factor